MSDASSASHTSQINSKYSNGKNENLSYSIVGSDQDSKQQKPLVSLVTPAYNEAIILEKNLVILCHYMQSLEAQYRWELIVVNDGSRDETGQVAEAFAHDHRNVRVVHHPTNFGMGQALRTGFDHAQGEYIVVLDMDLSFAPEHVERLLDKIRKTHADVVTASPYMKGGRVSNVPWIRLMLSMGANWFLSFATKKKFTSITGMARVYDAKFLRTLNLRSRGMDINPEIIHKASLLEARVEEIPAHLGWIPQDDVPKSKRRKSSMTTGKILKHSWAIVFFGFLFRPVMFFLLPSLLFFVISCYSGGWALVHTWDNYNTLVAQPNALSNLDSTVSAAVAEAFQQSPHSFILGGMSFMIAIQLFSLGVLAIQSKRYFEEIFNLGTSIYKSIPRK
jgi:glycosyltransferase involved in cell wall biosynthesis